MNELVTINPEEFGLTETRAAEVKAAFIPMIEKMNELENDYNEIVSLEISPETCSKAKDLRLQYVKIRTATAAIHKEAKAFYLAGGRFVDGWKNAQLHASQGKEEKLKAIEEHYERIEQEKKQKLSDERMGELSKYLDPDLIPSGLADMSQDVFNKYLEGVVFQYNAKLEAEKKAEEERLAREQAEREEQERIRKENEQLRKEAEKREKELAKERAEQEKKLAAEKAERERIERENQEKLAKERAERERLEQAERERKATEERAAAEKAEAERKAKAAPDKDKLIELSKTLLSFEWPTVSTPEAETIIKAGKAKMAEVIKIVSDGGISL